MIFSSVTFLFYFLPSFLVLYLLTNYKNLFLLVASLFFYAWGEVEYVAIMLISCLLNYLIGLAINRESSALRKVFLTIGLVLNLGILIAFKYTGFIVEILNNCISLFTHRVIEIEETHLPLGISFFTFQAITYLVDVYRRDATAEKNLVNLALYISMFPQLIAGPIVRYKMIAQEIRVRTHSLSLFVAGIKIFSVGLAQKVLIANTLALPADEIFGLPLQELNQPLAWLGLTCYTIQLYFDFGGYSNMAIGLGLMMGFHFPENFRYPYIAQSMTDLWQRWHITLAAWFRDYLYIPLGGNRAGTLRTYINLWVIFVLCGLWHGASWSFVVWGCYNGCFLILERLFLSRHISRWWRPLRHGYTLLIWVIGLVFFRSETLSRAVQFLLTMAGINSSSHDMYRSIFDMMGGDSWLAIFIGIMGSMPTIPWIIKKISPNGKTGVDGVIYHNGLIEAASLILVLAILFLVSMSLAAGAYNPFIYFRF